MTGVLLQARLGSTRLPRKAIVDIAGSTVIEHAMRSLRRIPCSRHAVVTDEESAPTLEPLVRGAGFDLFVGPPENVLERYVLAARAYRITEIIRATGDNPLVSWELARMAVAEFRRRRCDYFGYDGPPLGTGVEVVAAAALERALRESTDPYDLEHVTPYLYRSPRLFACARVVAPPAYCVPEARVTLDTPEDYRAIATIFSELYEGTPIANLSLVRWLRSRAAYEDPQSAYASRS